MTQSLLELDALNRERALEHASFIVEAPAGAGKTELLTQRYLSLLAIVNEPEEIIALTFTNKAAAEMRNRILLSLQNAQSQTAETAPHKLKTRELANAALKQSDKQQWNILQQPSRLRIMTMDALCSSLTRQMPLLSRFGGQPQVSDDTDTHYLEAARRAIAEVAQESSEDDTVTTALRYLDNNSEKLTALLAKMLSMRDQWLPLAGQLHGLETHDITAHTQAALEHLVTEYLESAFQVLNLEVQQCLMPLARFAASNLDEKARIMHLLDWQTALKAHPSELHYWQALARFLLTQSKTYRKKLDYRDGFPADKEHKPKKEEFFQIIGQLGDSTPIGNLLSLPALETLTENQPVIQALTRLLFLATTHLWAVFQAAGQVDFVAIAQSAQQALENEQGVTDLALKLDYQISHLLIDEFQDTSPVQMRLIEKLIEGWQPDDGRTLFCVGDPMQSIYRFRKADVSLFLQAAQYGIGHLPLTRLQLTRNNRSHPAVVDWVNNAFKQIFPARDNIHQGAIEYREFTASRNKLDSEGVVLHPLIIENAVSDDSESLDSKQVEASYVAKLIEQVRGQNRQDYPHETRKIAVLVRNRSHLRELVSEIRRNHPDLRFQAVEIEHLNDRQRVQDALSLTYAMHHRAERIHWLNILRAPWCGLTLADLHTLAAHDHYSTIWQLMHDETSVQRLSVDGQQRLMHVRNILTNAFDNQGRIPVRRWLESTWLQLGGSKCLVDAGDNRDVQAFFDLVEKSSRNGRLDMTALELGMQKLYAEPDIEADDSLQFLTIHKSKGLEFDTVILPALNRRPRNADNELVLWQEVLVNNQMHLVAAPMTTGRKDADNNPTVYDFLKELEAERNNNEIVRLLYVAATRSERYLHLIATMQKTAKDELKPVAKSLLEMLWPAVETEFIQAKTLDSSQYAMNLSTSLVAFVPKLQRLPLAMLMNPIVEFKAKNSLTAKVGSPTQELTNLADTLTNIDLQRHSGILAHKYMELIASTDLQKWTTERILQCRNAMQIWLVQQGHSTQDAQLGSTQVVKALQTTLESPQGQWVLHPHTEAVSELSLFDVNVDGVNLHVIDRTFVEEGIRWVVDYKLTHVVDLDLTLEAEQHRSQLERYSALFNTTTIPVKKAVFFLSLGKFVELS